jgi:hypothetical protein
MLRQCKSGRKELHGVNAYCTFDINFLLLHIEGSGVHGIFVYHQRTLN